MSFFGAIMRELWYYRNHQDDFGKGKKNYWQDRTDDLAFGIGAGFVLGWYGGDVFMFMAEIGYDNEWPWLVLVGNSWHPLWAFMLGLTGSTIIGWVIEKGWPWVLSKFDKK